MEFFLKIAQNFQYKGEWIASEGMSYSWGDGVELWKFLRDQPKYF